MRVFEQMLFHFTGIGPAFGQVGYFKRQAPEQIPAAIGRFQAESERVLAVLENTLADRPFVAGDAYLIADIAHFGCMWRREFAGLDFDGRPNIQRWYEAVAERPAVTRAVERITALVPPT